MSAAPNSGNTAIPSDGTLWYAAITRPRTSAFSQAQHVGICAIVSVGILLLNLHAPAHPTVLERCLASGLIGICFIPAWRWVANSDRNPPLLVFVTLLYAVYCALPIFLLQRYSRAWYLSDVIPAADMENALALSCLGLLAMIAGYTAGIVRRISRIAPKLALQWYDLRVVRDTGFGFVLGGLLLRVVFFRYVAYTNRSDTGVASGLQQFFYFMTEVPFVGLGMLWTLDLAGYLGPISRRFLRFAVIPVFLLIGLATGTIAQAIRVGLILLFISAMLRRRIPWTLLALGFGSIFVLQPTKTIFRADMNRQMNGAASGVIGRARTFVEITYHTLNGQSHLGVGIVAFSADRLNLITTFAAVVEDTPSLVPFWHGHTYYPLATKLIPRLLYPEKRPDDAGQAFPHRYGFLSPSDLTTSYKLAQLTEAYVNFGAPGVLMVMFVIGALYRITQELFVHPAMDIGAVVAVSYIVTQWFDIEANFSLAFGGLPYELVYIGIITILIRIVEGMSGARSLAVSYDPTKASGLGIDA